MRNLYLVNRSRPSPRLPPNGSFSSSNRTPKRITIARGLQELRELRGRRRSRRLLPGTLRVLVQSQTEVGLYRLGPPAAQGTRTSTTHKASGWSDSGKRTEAAQLNIDRLDRTVNRHRTPTVPRRCSCGRREDGAGRPATGRFLFLLPINNRNRERDWRANGRSG